MTARKKTAQKDPLPAIRAALAPGEWTRLDTLALLAGPGKGARSRAHAALKTIKGEGGVIEEQVGAGGVEVRWVAAVPDAPSQPLDASGLESLANGGAPCLWPGCGHTESKHGSHGGACTECSCPGFATEGDMETERAYVAAVNGEPVAADSAEPWEPEPPTDAEAAQRRADLDASLRLCPGGCGELGGECSCAKRPKPPGPSSRCAVCGVPFARHTAAHAPGSPYPPGIASGDGSADHAFVARKRGAPRGPRLQPGDGRSTPVRDRGTVTRAELMEALEGAPLASAVEGEKQPTPPPHPFEQALRAAYPEAFAPEIIDGIDVEATGKEMVDLSVAFSPVLPRRDSIDPCDVTPLESGRYRLDACWESSGLPIEVDDAGLKTMRARYLLRRGELLRALPMMDHTVKRVVVSRFFKGVEPWTPPAGSPLATMGRGPLTIAIPEGTGIEGIDWSALMGALSAPGGAAPTTVPLRELGPAPAPVPWEPPAAHVCEGEHGKACCRWKVVEPANIDPEALPEGFVLCRACWTWVRERGGGRSQIKREYVGDRYV